MCTRSFSFSTLLVALLSATAPRCSAFGPATRGTTSTISRGRSLASSSAVDEVAADAVNGESASPAAPSTIKQKKKMAVLLCPAQFCVPVDYTDLLEAIQSGHEDVDVVATRVAPLPRTEWIKVAKQLPTKAFLDAELSVPVTLDWYFDAIEEGLADLLSRGGDDAEICIIGHSIGGWVARAYLGGLSG